MKGNSRKRRKRTSSGGLQKKLGVNDRKYAIYFNLPCYFSLIFFKERYIYIYIHTHTHIGLLSSNYIEPT